MSYDLSGVYGNTLGFDAITSANAASKLIQESSELKELNKIDSFSASLMENKLESDATFLFGMSSSLEESAKEEYFKNLQFLLENTESLFKEVDMKPRTVSMAIDSQELNESTIQDIYGKNLTKSITKDFSQPLEEGKLLKDNKETSKLLLESAIKTGQADNIDAELFLKYSLFETTIVNNIKNVALPEELLERTEKFLSVQDASYFDIFDENASVLLKNIEEAAICLGSAIAPQLFVEGLNSTVDVKDIITYQGSSRIILAN